VIGFLRCQESLPDSNQTAVKESCRRMIYLSRQNALPYLSDFLKLPD
jgi:hypothetical protein